MPDFTLLAASRTDGLFRWTPATGLTRLTAPVDGLSSLAKHPVLPVVYGTSGMAGRLHAWRLDTGEPLAETASGGTEPCHLLVHPSGTQLIATNYESGTLVIQPLAPDGGFSGTLSLIQLTGSGPEAGRQDAAHPHQTLLHGDTLVVIDLGADLLREFSLDLTPGRTTPLPPGSGPRHGVVLPDGRIALSGELSSTLLVGRPGDPTSAWSSTPTTTRAPGATRNYPGDIQRSADGRFVYLANRGSDTIATFDVSAPTPILISERDAAIAWPQHMLVHADRLYVAGRSSGRVVVLPLAGGVPGPAEPVFDCPGAAWLLAV